ncbi:AP-1 complex subunit mu-2 [Sesamum angolense]|uniref:AP-1 complex subunit mu-2 n=1 Tax=Sesamum angolense TaxID=2727404 RepID=A0AAE1WU75_9LAMI|nr:AP-1 complex subunit mu-2 [Sesamum angolense]
MAGAASALFLLDIKGRVLVWRDYRGDVSAVQAERFFTKLIEKEGDPESQDPVVYDNGITYMFIQHNNVYLMTASRQNCNAASLLLFLHRVVDVFKHYFEELEEESLRDNFVVVYELLDEIMDFGYPQYTEAKILSEFIKTDAYRMEVAQRPPMAVTNAVSWRSEGIRYKKNEVFLDVVESVNILVNSNGQIIRSDVVGALKMRTYLRLFSLLLLFPALWAAKHLDFGSFSVFTIQMFMEHLPLGCNLKYTYAESSTLLIISQRSLLLLLCLIMLSVNLPFDFLIFIRIAINESGMPECKLGLNDRVLLEAQGRATKGKAIDLDDIKFHQCVRLARFENDRTISFIPPDGSFDLMTYRLSTQVKPLIWVEAQVERHSRSRIEIVKGKEPVQGAKVCYLHLPSTVMHGTATNVEIELPVPADATNPNVRTSMGSAAYAPEKDALIWKIKSFPGGKEYMLRAEFRLPSIQSDESAAERKAPVRVKFEIPYFTVSGIQVRYLKIIEKSGYQALPWVRYITMAGEYELRLM